MEQKTTTDRLLVWNMRTAAVSFLGALCNIFHERFGGCDMKSPQRCPFAHGLDGCELDCFVNKLQDVVDKAIEM